MSYHIMGEYYALCILRAMKICIFEVVSHRIDVVNYLSPMWHVCSNKFQFSQMASLLISLWILFVRYILGKVFLKCGPLYLKLENHLLQVILIIALRDCLTI